MSGLAYDSLTGIFSWTNGPDNGGLGTTYRCYAVDDPSAAGEATGGNTCVVPGAPTTGTVRLEVAVNGHSYNYDTRSE